MSTPSPKPDEKQVSPTQKLFDSLSLESTALTTIRFDMTNLLRLQLKEMLSGNPNRFSAAFLMVHDYGIRQYIDPQIVRQFDEAVTAAMTVWSNSTVATARNRQLSNAIQIGVPVK